MNEIIYQTYWMVLSLMKHKMCEICNKNFHPIENRSGIVLDEDSFVCEKCAKKIQSDDDYLCHSVMADTSKSMPIALWLIKEENKDKHFMSVKK